MSFYDKSPTMQAYLNSLAKTIHGRTVSEALSIEICVSCGKPVERDKLRKLDRDEYMISGLCPYCYPGGNSGD